MTGASKAIVKLRVRSRLDVPARWQVPWDGTNSRQSQPLLGQTACEALSKPEYFNEA